MRPSFVNAHADQTSIAPKPIREAASYSEEERKRFLGQFERKFGLVKLLGFLLGMSIVAPFVAKELGVPSWFWQVDLITFIVVSYLFAILFFTLRCPACHLGYILGWGPYCPQCGERSFGTDRKQCQCGFEVTQYDQHRRFKYRFCRRCGVLLRSRI